MQVDASVATRKAMVNSSIHHEHMWELPSPHVAQIRKIPSPHVYPQIMWMD